MTTADVTTAAGRGRQLVHAAETGATQLLAIAQTCVPDVDRRYATSTAQRQQPGGPRPLVTVKARQA